MTTANVITIIRILLIPLFMIAALTQAPYANWIAVAIFILASATDGLDGYIARKYNQITDLGKFLDPLADKLLVTAALLIFLQNGVMDAVAVMIILTREFAITSLRIVAMGKGVVIAAQMAGKLKTVIQIIGVVFLFTPLAQIHIPHTAIPLSIIMIWVMVAVTVISGIEYFVSYGKLLKAKGEEE